MHDNFKILISVMALVFIGFIFGVKLVQYDYKNRVGVYIDKADRINIEIDPDKFYIIRATEPRRSHGFWGWAFMHEGPRKY